ncbi:hypothetical protein ACVIHI_008718 [Bradyrhizobium sp. USDA 4524]
MLLPAVRTALARPIRPMMLIAIVELRRCLGFTVRSPARHLTAFTHCAIEWCDTGALFSPDVGAAHLRKFGSPR